MVEISYYDGPPMQVFGFLGQVSDLPKLKPGELEGTDSWLAEVDGEPVGMAVVDQDSGLIRRVGVLDAHQSQGVGSELLDVLFDEYDELSTRVDKENDGAQRFFESHGFTAVDRNGELINYER